MFTNSGPYCEVPRSTHANDGNLSRHSNFQIHLIHIESNHGISISIPS